MSGVVRLLRGTLMTGALPIGWNAESGIVRVVRELLILRELRVENLMRGVDGCFIRLEKLRPRTTAQQIIRQLQEHVPTTVTAQRAGLAMPIALQVRLEVCLDKFKVHKNVIKWQLLAPKKTT